MRKHFTSITINVPTRHYSVFNADELQKEMLRVTEIYAQNEDLKKIFDCIQFKEDITNNTSSEPFNPVVVPENKHDSLTESLNSARMLLRETSNELKNFVQNEDETE